MASHKGTFPFPSAKRYMKISKYTMTGSSWEFSGTGTKFFRYQIFHTGTGTFFRDQFFLVPVPSKKEQKKGCWVPLIASGTGGFKIVQITWYKFIAFIAGGFKVGYGLSVYTDSFGDLFSATGHQTLNILIIFSKNSFHLGEHLPQLPATVQH